jgi:hypothetical protein
MYNRGIYFLVIAFSAISIGCSGKSKSAPFWFLLGIGGAGNANSAGEASEVASDSNGVPLPASNDSVTTSGSGGIPTNTAVQEVPTSGPAHIFGMIIPTVAGLPATDVCGFPGAPSTPNCLDLTQIIVRIEVGNGGSYSLVDSANVNADGSFSFHIDDLPNNNYRVLINTGNGLNYSYQDFSYVFDPTQAGYTAVNVGNLLAERLYYTSGPASIIGSVSTPGFSGDGVSVPSGNLAGILVNLNDADGNLVSSTMTAGDGTFAFPLSNLPNGNYIITYDGSSVTASGQTYATNQENIHFTFQGTNPATTTVVNLGNTSLSWLAATESSITLNASIRNGAVLGDTSTTFTIKLKNEQGAIVDTTSRTGNGSFQLNASGLPGGVYYIEVSGPNFFTVSQSFLFSPAPDGGNKTITLSTPIGIVAKPSNVIGYVKDATGNHIAGSVINFRPDGTQPPSNLTYLLTDPQIGNGVRLWILEALSGVAGVNCAVSPASSPSICSCAMVPTTACLLANQGSGPWNYSTWGNKVYEVRSSDKQVYFTAAAGSWSYYISAPGYENWCGTNSAPCSSNPLSIMLNGNDFNAGNISMISISNRSQIAGTILVRDTAPSNPTLHTSQSGLFVVLLGNTSVNGAPLAHIAITTAGSYAFNGSSYVLTLPVGLTSDSQRVGYALQALASGGASTLANADTIAVDQDENAPRQRK